MKAIIITCFESNEERVSFVLETLNNMMFDTKVITTDFSHIKKQKRTNVPEGYITIETKPYSKNLSIGRMKSHARFAKDAFKIIEDEMPDLVWLMAPANSLIKQANISFRNISSFLFFYMRKICCYYLCIKHHII